MLVQSEIDGGAMHTMRFAERLGRERRAMVPLGEAGFEGNAAAIAGGAVALEWEQA